VEITVNVTTRDGAQLSVTSQPGQETLMQVLFDADVGVEAVCGGCASCATCHVFVKQPDSVQLPPRDEVENLLLEYQEHFDPERSRLSCQLRLSEALDGIAVEIAPEE
jgi:2Fe-2S ferredoxin